MNFIGAQTTCSCAHEYGTNSSSTTYWSGTGLSGGGTVTSQNFCIDRRLYIDVDARFSLCNFFMKPGSSIWVIDGSLFKASGTHFYKCGTSMWEGIYVNEGTIDFNHNWINDAEVGIDNPNGQPMIQFIGNTFDRCYVGLSAENISPARPFVGNNYFSNGTLITPHSGDRPALGMWLNNCFITERSGIYDHIRIGIEALNSVLMATKNKMTNSPHTAIFGFNSNLMIFQSTIRNYGLGIWSEESELRASNNVITNVESGIINQNCVNRSINTNDNVIDTFAVYGILQRNCSPTLNTYHDHNIITSNLKEGHPSQLNQGICLENDAQIREDNQALIQNNIISIDECESQIYNAIYANNIENILFEGNSANYSPASVNTREGLVGFGCSELELRNNDFTGGGDDTENSFGIDFYNVTNSFLCCNTATNLAEGVYFSGACNKTRLRGTIFDGPFIDHSLDFVFAITGVSQLFPGNDWSGSAPIDARYVGDNQQALNDPFIMSTNSLPFYPDDAIDGPNGWFRPDEPGDEYDCGDDSDCNAIPDIDEADYPNDDLLLTEGYDGEHGEGLSWQARKFLLQELIADPDYGDGLTQVDSFRTANSSTSLGKLARLANVLATLFKLSPELNDSLQELHDILLVESDSIFLADSMLEAEEGDPEYWEAFRVEHMSNFIDTSEIYSAFITDEHDLELDTVSNVINFLLASVVPTNIRDTNDVFVSRFYLNRLLDPDTPPEETDIDTLESIADQCPLDGGDAVIRARAILRTLDPEYFNPGASCTDVVELRSKRNSQLNQIDKEIFVYPNPNNGTFNIQFPKNAIKEKCSFTVSNLNGKILLSKELKDQNNIISLNLKEGLYFIKFVSGKNQAIIKKILIQ